MRVTVFAVSGIPFMRHCASLLLLSVFCLPHCATATAEDAAPIVIDDEALIKKFESEGAQLVQDGKTTEMKKLTKQMNRDRTDFKATSNVGAAASPDDVYAHCLPGVLALGLIYKCTECPDWHASAASAFVIHEDGLCVSNYHVFSPDPDEDIRGVVALGYDGTLYPVVEILAANKLNDCAVFRIDTGGKKLKALAFGTPPKPGARIGVLSNPAEHFFTYSTGIVSRYAKVQNEDGTSADGLYITCDFARGSSGGPVLNERGEVVGMAASTESCYYDDDGDKQKDLQMVFRACVPGYRIQELLKLKKAPETHAAKKSEPLEVK
jgi:serine protease Do